MTQSPSPLSRQRQHQANSSPTWSKATELVGLVFELSPFLTGTVPLQYTVGLHAWFLDQVRQIDPNLSAYLHDGESEKAFTLSSLEGTLISQGKELQLQADQIYRWYITGLSQEIVQWFSRWLEVLPKTVELRQLPLKIHSCQIFLPPTTYQQLLTTPVSKTLTLSFISPTSFRRKGHHFPLPMPVNLFHSYLRRWNDFSGMPDDQEAFLAWVDEGVIIHRHRLESVKVAAGKRGSVTGFTGAIEFGLTKEAQTNSQFQPLFQALGQFAPYCGTGHKTTFGLGQTRLGWLLPETTRAIALMQDLLAQRMIELTEKFLEKRQRTGGKRARTIAETWATILARRELGESLQAIAVDLEMPYETVKTYAKLARRTLKEVRFD